MLPCRLADDRLADDTAGVESSSLTALVWRLRDGADFKESPKVVDFTVRMKQLLHHIRLLK